MYIHSWYTFILLLFFKDGQSISFLRRNEYNLTLQISTTKGIIQGKESITEKGTKFFAYEGIPYAQPPANDLRFRSPKPAKRWKGVLDATSQGPGCLEMRLRFIEVQMVGYEDCLYINVFTPINLKITDSTVLLPVIFWIYGGAFFEGIASTFGPGYLLDQQIIVVTFNYRVGVFGFLSTQNLASPGNYGLKDQSEALLWVHKNIKKFGGDPNRVMISGHSAGSCSCVYQMLNPKSRGLFHGVVAWSGDTTTIWSHQKNPKAVATHIALALGIKTDNTTEMIERMKRLHIEDINRALLLVTIVHSINILSEGLLLTPTIEPDHPDAVITENSYELLKRGDFERVPVIFGMANLEMGLFAKLIYLLRPILILLDLSPSLIPNGLNNIDVTKNREIGEKIKDKYFESKSAISSSNLEILKLFTDVLFFIPIINTIRAMSTYTSVYFFVSDYNEKSGKKLLEFFKYPVDTNLDGVVHVEDLYLIWNYNNSSVPSNVTKLHKKFTKMWWNFASTGNPTPVKDPNLNNLIWPSVKDNKNIPYLDLGDEMSIGYNYNQDIINFWDKLENEYKIK